MIARILAVSAFTVALGAAYAAPANADAQGFLEDAHALGWYASRGDAGLLANGQQVCAMLNSNTGDVVARYVYQNTDYSVSRAAAMEFVLISVNNLCPWHDHRGQGQAA